MTEMKLANSNYIADIDAKTVSPICCIDAYLMKIAFPYVGYKTLKTLRIFDLLRNTQFDISNEEGLDILSFNLNAEMDFNKVEIFC